MPSEQSQLYVRFVDGSNACIPVPSRPREEGSYEILPYHEFDYDDDSILFEFGPGDVVAAEPTQFGDGSTHPLAVRLVERGDARNLSKRMLFAIVSDHPNFQDLVAQFGEEEVRQIASEGAKMEWVYPAISAWIKAHGGMLEDA